MEPEPGLYLSLSLYCEQRFIRQFGQLNSHNYKLENHNLQVSLNSVIFSQLDLKLIEFSAEY